MNVQDFDYAGLVLRMAGVEVNGEARELLSQALKELGDPRYETEKTYFWRALANAARHHAVETGEHQVWLWLCVQFPSLNPTNFVMPEMVPDWELPEIRETDEPAKPGPKMMSAETT